MQTSNTQQWKIIISSDLGYILPITLESKAHSIFNSQGLSGTAPQMSGIFMMAATVLIVGQCNFQNLLPWPCYL